MSIKVQITGEVPYYLTAGDEFLVSFDISSWIGSDQIDTVDYSAVDESGEVTVECFDANKATKTNTIFRPYIKAGDEDQKKFILKCLVTTLLSYVKAFYVKFEVNETLAQKT
jgi:hypothetical protein